MASKNTGCPIRSHSLRCLRPNFPELISLKSQNIELSSMFTCSLWPTLKTKPKKNSKTNKIGYPQYYSEWVNQPICSDFHPGLHQHPADAAIHLGPLVLRIASAPARAGELPLSMACFFSMEKWPKKNSGTIDESGSIWVNLVLVCNHLWYYGFN